MKSLLIVANVRACCCAGIYNVQPGTAAQLKNGLLKLRFADRICLSSWELKSGFAKLPIELPSSPNCCNFCWPQFYNGFKD